MTAPLPVEDALARILARCHPLPAEAVPLAAAAGRVLAQDRCSDLDLPPFDNSAMDGYAVRLADVAVAPVTLPVQEQIAAGGLTPAPLRSGHIAKIMTGAPIPDGTEAVVPVEATTGGPDQVTIDRPPRPAANIRRAGEDVARGERVVAAGCTLGYAELAVLAAVGCAPVPVTRRPRAVVVSTGDELVPADATPGPGQIRDSSILAIPALLTAAGAEVVRVAHAVDSAAALEALFDDVGNVELVVTCGGVSMGDHDQLLAQFGRQIRTCLCRVCIILLRP